jgi:urea transport system permease protein
MDMIFWCVKFRKLAYLLNIAVLAAAINLPAVAEDDVQTKEVTGDIAAPVENKPATSLLGTITPLLVDGSFGEKADAVDIIFAQDPQIALRILGNLFEGNLFYKDDDNTLYEIKEIEQAYTIVPMNSNGTFADPVGAEAIDDYSKIRINNSLRTRLRQAIAVLQLKNPDEKIRAGAVTDMLGRLDEEALARIAEFRVAEKDSHVAELMDIALAVGNINSGDEQKILQAINVLGESLEPVALNTLREYLENTEDSEKTGALKVEAGKAIRDIEGRQQFFQKLETLYFGLSFGSVLVLAGIGLAITFGVMGVINMAHGELIMLGAYTTFVIQQLMPNNIGLSIIVAIPAAFMVSAMAGMIMERLVIRHLYGRPLETLLATFGISLILQQAVRSIFSPLNRTVITPEWMSGMLQINSVFSITWNRLYIIIFCMIVFCLLLLIMKKSALGLQVRAVAQNRMMARAMGVRSERVDVLTFGMGAGIAGIAGVALSLLTNVGPNLGQSYIIDSFIVVVFGGVGNLFGTLVAGMSLGVANKVLEPWAGAVLAKILLLVFIILFIQKRPQGLFPQRGRAVEN